MPIHSIQPILPTAFLEALTPGGPIGAARSPTDGGSAAVATEIIRDSEGLDALERDWRALESRIEGASFFAGFDWTRAWWDNFGGNGQTSLAVIAARLHGRLVAVVPLVVSRAGPYAWASPTGAGSGRYSMIAIDREVTDLPAIRLALWRAIRATGADTLVADNVPADSDLASLLAGRRALTGAESRDYRLILGDYPDMDHFLATRPSGLVKSLRRRRRRLLEKGPVRYEVLTGREEIVEAVDEMVRLKRSWFAERGLHGRFLCRPAVTAWLADLCTRAAGRLHLSVLKLGERIIAGQLAFVDGTTLTCYFAAFDVRYSRESAGKLHLQDLVRECFETGFDLDLMPPSDEYKREWATPGTSTFGATVPLTPLGSVVTLLHNARLRDRLKQIYLATPRRIRAGLAPALDRAARSLAGILNRAGTSRDDDRPAEENVR